MAGLIALALGVLWLQAGTAGSALAAAPDLPPAAATGAGELPSRAEIEALIGTLQDDKARAELIGKLKALSALQEKPARRPGLGARVLAGLSNRMENIVEGFVQIGERVSRPDVFVGWLEHQVRSPDRRLFWARVLGILLGVFAAAALADWIVQRLLGNPRQKLVGPGGAGGWARGLGALLRGFVELIPIAAFAAAGFGVLALTGPSENVRLVALAVLNGVISVRVLVLGARILLSPLAPSLRLLPVGDETAAYAFVWARRFIIVAVYGYFAGQLSLLLGLSEAGHGAVMKLIGLIVTVIAAILLLQIRPRVTESLRGDLRPGRHGLGRIRRYIAEIWHVAAIVLLFAAYFIWALAIRGGFAVMLRGVLGTAVILGFAKLLMALEHRLLRQFFSVSADFRARYPTLEERASRYVPIVRGCLSAIILLVAAIFILQVWGVDVLGLLATDVARNIALGALRILVIVVVAMAVIEGAGLAIARYLNTPGTGGVFRERSARARTLLPLIRNVIVLIVGSIAAISVLSQLGVDVAPLIAGVGIFGLAVGFGAQSLVKDVITGAFILFEDTIAVGDIIEVGAHGGTVEALSIRSVRLRDLSGHVHTVPFGAIEAVINRTKGWAYYVSDIGVAYRENTDAVTNILVDVVEQMRRDDAYSASIVSPLEVMGVQSFGDSAVVLRVRIHTLAKDQWRVGREFNRRVKHAFDAHGIEMPFPHRTLYFGVEKSGGAPPARVVLESPPDSPPAAEPPRGVAAPPEARGAPPDAENGGAP